MAEEAIRFGLVGYGMFGKHHANLIESVAGASLAGIAVRSEASQKEARENHPHVPVVGDAESLVGRDDVDVVDIVVPNQLHFSVAEAALRAGKHVFVEKPMALEAEQCDQLLRLAEEQGKMVAVNHELRLSTLWGEVRRRIDEGSIGSPQYGLIELARFPYRGGSAGWRYDIERVGSWVLEEPIHFFDLARWYFAAAGEPWRVDARANSRQPDHPELLDNFSALVDFPSHAYVIVSQTLAAFGHHVNVKVSGTEGALWAYWSAADARSSQPRLGLQYGHGDQIETVRFPEMTGELVELRQQLEAVVRCLREGGTPPASGNDGRWSVLLCRAAERSIASGEPERLQ